MPELGEPWVPYLLWSLAGLLLTICCLPAILHILGFTTIISRLEKDLAGFDPESDSESYTRVYGDLKALGFEPAGSYREDAYFLHFHWRKSFWTRAFFNREHRCWAAVYRYVAGEEPIHAAFATVCTDGSLVWSGDDLEELQNHEDDYVRTGLKTPDLAELLAYHRQVVETFFVEGKQAADRGDVSLLAEASRRVSQRHARGDRSIAIGTLNAVLFFALGLPAMAMWAEQLDWKWLPLWIIATCIVVVLMRLQLPRLIRQERQDAAQQ